LFYLGNMIFSIRILRFIFYALITGCAAMSIWHIINENVYFKDEKTPNLMPTESSARFDLNTDTLVFIHIQKTGGSSFDRNIIKNLLVQRNNRWHKACLLKSVFENKNKTISKKRKFKNYSCPRDTETLTSENWYFSRQTYGWVCGLHADYTRLTKCVKKFYNTRRKLQYYTILREPVRRYLSEWQHVSRGATWSKSKNQHCNK